MNKETGQIVYAEMKSRQMGEWSKSSQQTNRYLQNKRQLRNVVISMAAVLCLGIGAYNLTTDHEKATEVMSHITADFEYDDTLGRLQFVSNILPDSVMVFLENKATDISVFAPTEAATTHTWNDTEPWLEFDISNEVSACSDGDVMTVVKNRNDMYTVRILHNDGYESVYSGLDDVNVAQLDRVLAGDRIGSGANGSSFELRKDGLSVMPQFQVMGRN